MKRLLILFALLGVMLLPQAAFAAPFAFGPDNIFNDSASFSDNMTKLMQEHGASGSFSSVTLGASEKYYFTGIGYSQYAAQVGGVSLFVDNVLEGNMTIGYNIAGKHLPDDIYLRYWNDDEMDMMQISLTDAWFEVVKADTDVNFVINGEDYSFAAGTLFISFTFKGGPNDNGSGANTPDFILAASPTSAVPVPAAVWLMGSGLAGIVAIRRRLN